jgi:hypothetical protein
LLGVEGAVGSDSAGAVDLLGDDGSSFSTGPRSALRDVLNLLSADGDRLGIEVGVEQRIESSDFCSKMEKGV